MVNTFFYKLFRFEFWPWYAIYLPLFPIYIFGVFYTRRLLYFTSVNPGIDMGGFYGERKDDIQELFSSNYLVKSVVIKNGDIKNLEGELIEKKINYPVIAKPIVGERGEGVRKIVDFEELLVYANSESDFIVQEYIDYSLELGLLFYTMPKNSKTVVSSIAEKKYLSVTGNGKDSVLELLKKHRRNSLYLPLVQKEYSAKLSFIPLENEQFVVHSIGNHIKGTKFLNANNRINEKVENAINEIVKDLKGVYFGRFDLKVPSYQDLENGKNIKIFELNGVSAEPAHIYGLSNVVLAYLSLAKHWIVVIRIAKQNIKKGVKTTPLNYFTKQLISHFG